MTTVTLDSNTNDLVLINTFTVDPAKADDLIKVLSDVSGQGMNQRPGFISANLHMSHDRTRVANSAQWRSKADLDAMMSDPFDAEAGPGRACRTSSRHLRLGNHLSSTVSGT